MSYADTKDTRITRMSVLKSAVDTAAATGTVAGIGLAAATSEILAVAAVLEAWVNAAKSDDAPEGPPKAAVATGDDGKTIVGTVETCRRDGTSFKVDGQWYKITAMTKRSMQGNLWRQRVRVGYAVGTHGRIATAIDPA